MIDDGTVTAAPWFVDAWAVRDGAIFASQRSPGGLDARSTVFICVPDLAIVPVGRQSTALAATRRQFQEGLTAPTVTDEPGDEIAFDDLEQVRELVRRGYLGGGLGPDGVGPGGDDPVPGADGTGAGGDGDGDGRVPPAPAADRWDPGEPEPGRVAESLRELDVRDEPWRWDGSVAEDLDRLAAGFRDPELRERHPLTDAVQAYTRAVTDEWERRFERSRSAADGQLLSDWYDVQSSLAAAPVEPGHVEPGHVDLGGLFPVHGAGPRDKRDHAVEFSGRWSRAVGSARPWNAPAPSLSSIVAAAPCPDLPGQRGPLRRLREAVLLPMVDPTHWMDSTTMVDLAPAVVAALVLTSSMTPTAPLQFRDSEWEVAQHGERMATALEWLRAQMPTELPKAAELVMSMFVERQLGGPEPEPQWLLN